MQGIYFGLGVSGSKPGARDKAVETAMGMLDAREVEVELRQRRWRNRNYPEFVMTNSRSRRDTLPPFSSPPEGTADFEDMKDEEQKKRQKKERGRAEKKASENPNISHVGPPCRPCTKLENFVIMLKPNENAICILNTSAQFCKMGLDFYFEIVHGRKGHTVWVCTLFLEGEAIADGKGSKKQLKAEVAERGLESLSKFCYIVAVKDTGIDTSSMMSRREIKQSSAKLGVMTEEDPTGAYYNKSSGEDVGSKMLKMMGWKEGEGLGQSGSGIVNPVKMRSNSEREGLGSKAINSDNINKEEAEEIIRNYASNDDLEDLTFSSELMFDERKEIMMMSKRYGLSSRTKIVNEYGKKKIFLMLSKKIGPEVIIEQLEREGREWGRYQLIKPRGDRSGDLFRQTFIVN